MKVTGTIIAKNEHKLTLAVNSPTNCASCQANKQCITGVLTQQSSAQATIELTNDDLWRVGQPIELAITPYSLLKGAMWVYLLPLAGLFAFAALTQYCFATDGLTALAGVVGLLLGGLLAQRLLKRYNWQQQLTLHSAATKTNVVDG